MLPNLHPLTCGRWSLRLVTCSVLRLTRVSIATLSWSASTGLRGNMCVRHLLTFGPLGLLLACHSNVCFWLPPESFVERRPYGCKSKWSKTLKLGNRSEKSSLPSAHQKHERPCRRELLPTLLDDRCELQSARKHD